MYIDSLTIENITTFPLGTKQIDFLHVDRGFGSPAIGNRDAEMPKPRFPNINLLLGENGAGKTTLLRAIAASCFGPAAKDILRDGSLVRLGEHAGRIFADLKLHNHDRGVLMPLFDEELFKSDLQLERRGERLFVTPGPPHNEQLWSPIYESANDAFFVAGYGATRRVERLVSYDAGARAKSRATRDLRVQSLFEDAFSLIPLASWLPKLKKTRQSRFDEISKIINKILSPGYCHFTGKQDEVGDYMFAMGDMAIPFQMLSDGYRACIGWVGDLLFHLHHGNQRDERLADMQGVVLVDEIDLHLHPRWQTKIIQSIVTALPNIQFFFTSHSPLVTGSLEWMNIILLKTSRKLNRTTSKRLPRSIHGLDADQILLSKFFGLKTSRAASKRQQLARLRHTASLGDDDAKQRYLRALSSGMEPGESPFDDEVEGRK